MDAAFDAIPETTRRDVVQACAAALARPIREVDAAVAAPYSPRAPSGLYAIVNATATTSATEITKRAKALSATPVAFIQLRAKDVTSAQRRTLVEALCRSSRIPVIVNDDVEVALATNAAGVHLGRTDGSATAARQQAHTLGRDDFIIGRSSNNAIQYRQAEREPVDYIALGPIFESPTKRGHAPPVGLDMLSEVAADAPRPLCAIGGLTGAGAVCRAAFAGADLCAVVSALTDADDETDAAWALCFAHAIGAQVRAVARGASTLAEDL